MTVPNFNLSNEAAVELATRREVWQNKYAIRACYRGWFERLRPYLVPGVSIEIGGGFGGSKEFWPELIATDVIPFDGLDLAVDGLHLPFAEAGISNILLFDLLHHLRDPHVFFDEATRVLRPGGRVLMIEPYITCGSWLPYRLAHHERVCFDRYHADDDKSDPWEGNLALANIVLHRERRQWPVRHPELRILCRHCFSLLDFQLAGGFKPWSLVRRPWLYDALLRLDRCMDFLAPILGFRVLCVIERV